MYNLLQIIEMCLVGVEVGCKTFFYMPFVWHRGQMFDCEKKGVVNESGL